MKNLKMAEFTLPYADGELITHLFESSDRNPVISTSPPRKGFFTY